jgi:hypothetical protein
MRFLDLRGVEGEMIFAFGVWAFEVLRDSEIPILHDSGNSICNIDRIIHIKHLTYSIWSMVSVFCGSLCRDSRNASALIVNKIA